MIINENLITFLDKNTWMLLNWASTETIDLRLAMMP